MNRVFGSLAGVLALATAACTASVPPPAPAAAPPRVQSQTQALTAGLPSVGRYDVRFAAQGPATPGLDIPHQLSLSWEDGELQVMLMRGAVTLRGTAEVLDSKRWLVGLAGFEEEGAPLVMQMNLELGGQELRGSVVVNTSGESFTGTFVAVREVKETARTSERHLVAPEPASSRFHLPGEAK